MILPQLTSLTQLPNHIIAKKKGTDGSLSFLYSFCCTKIVNVGAISDRPYKF